MAFKYAEFPTVNDSVDLSSVIPVTGIFTVTWQVAVFAPSFVVTVMVALPDAFAVTRPDEDTVATEVLLEVQVTDLSDAFEGVTVAES